MSGVKVLETSTIFYIIFSAILASFYVLNSNSPTPVIQNSQIIIPIEQKTPKVETASQISPDGKANLTMEVTHNNDGSYFYRFTTEVNGNSTTIYRATTDKKTYSIPFNTWSPNNQYLFIYEEGRNKALIFSADASEFAENEAYIDLAAVFKAKFPTHTINEVTGWADPALVIINAQDENGSKRSFWLEIPSKIIIPLATNFYD